MIAGASFERAIESLAHAARLDLAHSAIERARETCGIRTFSKESWVDDLTRLGLAVGLRIRAIELSVQRLLQGEADEILPLVRIEARGEGIACLTVLERRAGRVRATLGDDPTVLTLDEAALAKLLETSHDAEVRWATGDPCTSLGHRHHPTPAQRLLSWIRLERDDLGVVVIFAAGVGLLSLATPLGVQFLVNTVAFATLLQPLVVLTVLVLCGLAIEALLHALQSWVIERIQQRVFVRAALETAYRLPRVKQEELDAHYTPELVNRFFDIVALQKGAATLLSDGVAIVLSALVGMLILAFYHPFLLAFDVVLLVGITIVVFVGGRNAVRTSIEESEAKYAIAAWLEDAAAHRSALSLGEGPAYVAARAESLTREWLGRRKAHWRIVFRQVTSALALRAFACAALLGLGGWLVLSRQLTLGQLVASELIVSSVVAGFAKFGKTAESFYDLVTATEKLGHLVDLDLVRSAGGEVAKTEQGLEVTLSGGSEIHLAAGSRTVIHGSGDKSGFVDALASIRERGRLVIDGVPAADLSPHAIRAVIAIVRQPEVFRGTVYENVAIGRVDRQSARDALAAVGLGLDLDEHLESHGLDGRTGILLTIARAIASAPRLLMLDGALDALSDSDRAVVWQALEGKSWTVVVTTSRPELTGLATSYELHA